MMKLARIAACGVALLTLSVHYAAAAPALATNNVNMRQGPGTNYPVVTTIPGGGGVEVNNCYGEWCSVPERTERLRRRQEPRSRPRCATRRGSGPPPPPGAGAPPPPPGGPGGPPPPGATAQAPYPPGAPPPRRAIRRLPATTRHRPATTRRRRDITRQATTTAARTITATARIGADGGGSVRTFASKRHDRLAYARAGAGECSGERRESMRHSSRKKHRTKERRHSTRIANLFATKHPARALSFPTGRSIGSGGSATTPAVTRAKLPGDLRRLAHAGVASSRHACRAYPASNADWFLSPGDAARLRGEADAHLVERGFVILLTSPSPRARGEGRG